MGDTGTKTAPSRRPPDSGRQAILHILKTKGPQTAADLAKRQRVTPMAVHQHLAKLRDEGLVRFTKERRKLGRPAHLWELTPKANRLFPDRHADLAVGLVQAIEVAFGDEGLQRLTQGWTRLQLERYGKRMPKDDASFEKRLRVMARIRRGEGFMPQWGRDQDGAMVYAENHCSIAKVAQCCSHLCDAELSLFQELLGKDVRVERREHLLQGDPRCGYHIIELGTSGQDKTESV